MKMSSPRQGRIVALVGAESTGKTTLAHDLFRALLVRGHDAVIVPETLREFCDTQGRTPRADEQAALAAEHSRRIREAAGRHTLVLADTTALMTAVYSELLFDDRSLYAEAMAEHARCELTLLTSLDLAWVADGLQRDGPQVREPVDRLVRQALIDAGQPFGIVAGQGDQRLRHALAMVDHMLDAPARVRRNSATGATGVAGTAGTTPRWRAVCAHCDDDAACEQHWLTRGLRNGG
ncbi:ATP-binding protein [Aquabacterium sp.]|uniref:ATP-binding protein n=1 Tax=Aquabacterium sp. TaxID=1872578 RepID=UPI0025C57BF3|nr:ATP-binding protein [Aquabacterium sp.]